MYKYLFPQGLSLRALNGAGAEPAGEAGANPSPEGSGPSQEARDAEFKEKPPEGDKKEGESEEPKT